MASERGSGAWKQIDDSQLIASAQAGDRDAFGEIYRRYKDALLRLARARLSDPLAAEEIVQDAFIKAFTSLSRIDPSRPLGPWLATITANLVIDAHRRKHVIPIPEPIVARDHVDETAEAVLAAEGVQLLRRAIGDLPLRQRRIFMASVFEHASSAEVARLENVSESSVISVVYRARQAVRRNMRHLATVVIAVRFSALKNRARRAAAALDQAPMFGELRLAACCWSVAIVMSVVPSVTRPPVPPTQTAAQNSPSSMIDEDRQSYRALAAVPSATTTRTTHGQASDVSPSGEVTGDLPIHTSDRSEPPNEGAAASPEREITVGFTDPFGRERSETISYSCDGNGSDLLPDDGIYTSIC